MGLDAPSVQTIEIDLEQINKVREKMPIVEHRRSDLYSLSSPTNLLIPIDSFNEKQIQWGQLKISTDQIFFRTALTMALVNKKPVVPGRMFSLLSEEIFEIFDLYRCSCFTYSSCGKIFSIKS